MIVVYRVVTYLLELLYTRFAFAYDLVAGLVSNGRWKEWGASLVDLIDGPTVLELGCGPGHLQLELRRKGLAAHGIDASASMVRLTRNRLASHAFQGLIIQALAQQLPYPARVFDQLVATFPTAYILSPLTIREIWRVLTPKGSIYIIPAASITGRSLYDKIAQWIFRATGQDAFQCEYLKCLFESAGFYVQSYQVHIIDSTVIIFKATKP